MQAKQTPKCIHCKSKNTRHRRTRNGNEQFLCKDCGKCFTVQRIEKGDACYIDKDGSVKKTPNQNKPSKVREGHEIDRRQETFDMMDAILYLWSENTDLESRLDHADKVNLANVKLMQEKDKAILEHLKKEEENKEKITGYKKTMEEQQELVRQGSKDIHELQMQVSRRNVAICLLVAGLAIVSGLLFY